VGRKRCPGDGSTKSSTPLDSGLEVAPAAARRQLS
jgi:hypothetical protein